jgi:hypothetical protein
MTITDNWTMWIGKLSKARKVIAVEIHAMGKSLFMSKLQTKPKGIRNGR